MSFQATGVPENPPLTAIINSGQTFVIRALQTTFLTCQNGPFFQLYPHKKYITAFTKALSCSRSGHFADTTYSFVSRAVCSRPSISDFGLCLNTFSKIKIPTVTLSQTQKGLTALLSGRHLSLPRRIYFIKQAISNGLKS